MWGHSPAPWELQGCPSCCLGSEIAAGASSTAVPVQDKPGSQGCPAQGLSLYTWSQILSFLLNLQCSLLLAHVLLCHAVILGTCQIKKCSMHTSSVSLLLSCVYKYPKPHCWLSWLELHIHSAAESRATKGASKCAKVSAHGTHRVQLCYRSIP